MKLYDFMTDPDLCGTEFRGKSWNAHRVIARLYDGDAELLSDDEAELALKITGRAELPTERPKVLGIGAGRRGGKTRLTSVIGLCEAMKDFSDVLAPGETAIIALIAPTRDQASLLLDYSRGLVQGSEVLSSELIADTANALEFKGRTRIEVTTGSYRTVRSRTLAAAVIDEASFLRSDESALPDEELFRALWPALVTLKGPLIVISSPHRKVGLMYRLYKQYYGDQGNGRGLFIQASTRTLNPTIGEEVITEAMNSDPEAARSEWLAEFRSDLTEAFPGADITLATQPGRRMLPRMPGQRYVAFLDPSGGRHDAMTLAIAHREGQERVVLDVLKIQAPPFDVESTLQNFAETLSAYGLSTAWGDRYGAEWVRQSFARYGIAYTPSDHDKSTIYSSMIPLFAQGFVELLDVPRLDTELRLLERKVRPGGRGDSIDHGRNGHDDCANAACGALLYAANQPADSRDGYESGITHAATNYSPWERDSVAPDRPIRHRELLPANLQARYGTEDFSESLREYDPMSRD